MWDVMNILTQYKRNTSGSVAVISAILATVLLIGIGVAIDYASMVSKRTYLQNVADSAILAAVLSGETDQAKLQLIADEFIASSDYPDATVTVSTTKDDTAIIEISQSQEMLFMGAFGEDEKVISASTEVPLAGSAKLNLALVLDTTGSMEGSRMTALKTATENLMSEFSGINDGGENVKISVVPFADYVRISENNEGQIWLNVAPDETVSWQVLDEENSTNCRQVGSGETATTECDNAVYKTETGEISWAGCMASRRDGYHKIPGYNGRRMQGPAGHMSCGSHYNEMSPLTSDLSTINPKIAGLNSYGKTYLPSGLIWGWRTLDASLPFTESAQDDKTLVNDVLLLMTDGSNTTSLNGERDDFDGIFHWSYSNRIEEQRVEADQLTLELCTSVKNQNIQIITVAFEVDDADTRNMLKSCASSGKDFYNATDAAKLKKAFSDIGAGLNEIRLIR